MTERSVLGGLDPSPAVTEELEERIWLLEEEVRLLFRALALARLRDELPLELGRDVDPYETDEPDPGTLIMLLPQADRIRN